jgi:chitin disaccharide deacetylase
LAQTTRVSARYLIVHVDDLGMAHSVNAATFRAFETGLVSSASVMVPCAWFPEVAEYARTHPRADIGVHLTLTCERTHFRWAPVSPKNKVPSLIDRQGYLLSKLPEAGSLDLNEVELEVRAQIDRTYRAGVFPTHLDSHQFWPFRGTKELFDVMQRVAHDYSLPFLLTRDWYKRCEYLESSLGDNDLVIDRLISIGPEVQPSGWEEFYRDAIISLPVGVSQLLIHVALDNDEMRSMTKERETWGAAWRQRDFDICTSERFRQLLQEQDITLLTWRDFPDLARTSATKDKDLTSRVTKPAAEALPRPRDD